MNLIQYNKRLWQLRDELEEKGVFKPINMMVKADIISQNKRNHNLISGRVHDCDFLELLERFNDSQ